MLFFMNRIATAKGTKHIDNPLCAQRSQLRSAIPYHLVDDDKACFIFNGADTDGAAQHKPLHRYIYKLSRLHILCDGCLYFHTVGILRYPLIT